MSDRTAVPATRGFTAIEMVIVVVLIGILTTVAIPFIRDGTIKSNVRGAASAIASLHAVARNAAVQRGRVSVLVLKGSTATVLVALKRTGSTVMDTVGAVENLGSRFGVALSTTQDSIIFTPRGIGTSASNTTVIVSRNNISDTLTIAAAGRLLR